MDFNSKKFNWGPGVWFTIHINALAATNTSSKKEYVKFLRNLQHFIPCSICKIHFLEYLETNKPENLINKKQYMDDDKKDVNMFIWSFDFHNSVNKRLGKKIIKLKDAYEFYKNLPFRPCEQEDCEI